MHWHVGDRGVVGVRASWNMMARVCRGMHVDVDARLMDVSRGGVATQ